MPGRCHGSGVARFAEGEDATVLKDEGSQAEEVLLQEHPMPVLTRAMVFKELNVSEKTEPKLLMKKMVAMFQNEGERVIELVLTAPRAKHVLMYALALVPDFFRIGAQVLIRRRDRRLRIRVIRDFQPEASPMPQELRISANITNLTIATELVKGRFVDGIGNNLNSTVKLKFQGAAAAANAILIIETVGKSAWREFTWWPRYVEEELPVKLGSISKGSESAGSAGKQVSIVVTLVAT